MKLLIYSGFFILFLFSAKPVFAFDQSYLKGKAIEQANFSLDELVVEPKLIFSLAGEREQASVNPYDRVVNLIDPRFSPIGISAVFTAPKYKIIDQSTSYDIYSFKRRVGDILGGGGVVLAKEDVVDPTPENSLSLGTNTIKITRVSVSEIEKFEAIPYQTKKIDDPDLERGRQIVSQAGKSGKELLLYRVRRENGVEVERNLIKEEIVEKPQNKIISVGTKIVVLSSVSGIATATNLSSAVVSANYPRGTLVRITNLANGVNVLKTVNYTWGTSSASYGVVLDLSWSIMDELRFNGSGSGPSVLVEEIKQ